MQSETSRYITTTLPYVNADPHAGFALEILQADVLARAWRNAGHDVFFNTGTDEHGQKIAQKADEAGQDRQAYVDYYANEFSKLRDGLDLSYDAFIRTTDPSHQAAAQDLWRRCDAAGDIYKQSYKGLYCVGCERFVKETELVDGKCPEHPSMLPEVVEEENYFFRLSKYQSYLESYLSEAGVIVPEWRRKEALAFVQNGLEDFSISRRKERMDWGVPVPGDADHVMYVWFDALTNYISTLGWPDDMAGHFARFWKEGKSVQMAGKDQVRFQSIMWQAMLKSAGLPATDCVFYHGFINSGGQKMSKSIGNVISPYDMTARYGTEATRYILLRHVHPSGDSDLTWELMDEQYTAHLVNGLGNLTSRIMKMSQTHVSEPVTILQGSASAGEHHTHQSKVTELLDDFDFQGASDYIWEQVGALDERITQTEPFRLIKTDQAAGEALIKELVTALDAIAIALAPFMPQTSMSIRSAIEQNEKPVNLFMRLT